MLNFITFTGYIGLLNAQWPIYLEYWKSYFRHIYIHDNGIALINLTVSLIYFHAKLSDNDKAFVLFPANK